MSGWGPGIAAAEELIEALTGVHVRKALDPLSPSGFLLITERVAASLRKAVAGAEADVVQLALDELDVDWEELSAEQITGAVRAANTAVAKFYDAKVLPKISDVMTVEGPKVMEGTKASVLAREKLEIKPSLSQRDEAAEAAIRRSQVNFIRDSNGVRLGASSGAAREIVARGLSQGVGRKQMAKDLRDHFAQSVPRPTGYWNTVASVYVGRARSTSQIFAYEDASITSYEVVAVLDEVTTDQCRFMNGKVFSVRSARAMLETLESLDNPEDVKFANPWIRKGKDSSGAPRLFVPHANGSTTTVAKITRSGVGAADDAGEYSGGKDAAQLAGLGVHFPPYHGHCRTVIVSSDVSVEQSPVTVPADLDVSAE